MDEGINKTAKIFYTIRTISTKGIAKETKLTVFTSIYSKLLTDDYYKHKHSFHKKLNYLRQPLANKYYAE